MVIACRSHRDAIGRELERRMTETPPAWRERVLWLDDKATLVTFMRTGQPNADSFEANVGRPAADLQRRFGRLAAFGDMVGRLWTDRAFGAAIQLERLWNDLLHGAGFDLFCGYPIDVLLEEFQFPTMRAVIAQHTRVVTSLPMRFNTAMRRAIDEFLGEARHGSHAVTKGRLESLPTQLPDGEETILRLRSALPRYAGSIIAKARDYATE